MASKEGIRLASSISRLRGAQRTIVCVTVVGAGVTVLVTVTTTALAVVVLVVFTVAGCTIFEQAADTTSQTNILTWGGRLLRVQDALVGVGVEVEDVLVVTLRASMCLAWRPTSARRTFALAETVANTVVVVVLEEH